MAQQRYLSNNRLIFYRVESAGRVHQTSSHFQHLAGMQGNAKLQRVETIAIARGPAPPDVRSLANGAITTTWYVTQDAIKQDGLLHQATSLNGELLRPPVKLLSVVPVGHRYCRSCWLTAMQ